MAETFIPESLGNYKLQQKIGSGSFAEVWLAVHEKTNKTVAVKIISKSKFNETKHVTRFNREVAFMKQIDHPLIAQLFQVMEDEKNHYLIMEYCSGPNLLQYINSDGKLEETLARQYFLQLVSVVEYLHTEKNIIHRDLKAENILLDRNYNIRLIDFGLSNSFTPDNQNLVTACGSPGYLPPEMIKGHTHTTAADIWSLGVVLFCMTVGRLPFDDSSVQQLFNKIVNTQPFIPRTLSADLNNLLKRMLIKDPEQRITLNEIKEHPWFSQETYEYLNGRLLRTIPVSSLPEKPVISNFSLNDDVLTEMKNLGYSTDGMEQRLLARDFDEESAVYLLLSKHIFTDQIKDVRDVGIKNDNKRVAHLMRTRSPSFNSSVTLSSGAGDGPKPLVAPKVATRPRMPVRSKSNAFAYIDKYLT